MGASQRLYRHGGGGLLRAARSPLHRAPDRWPDLSDNGDVAGWRSWLVLVWSREKTAEAVALASPSLARQVTQIYAGLCTEPKQVRRAVVSVVRYLLRETGRPTPFGLFAGVAPARFAPAAASVRWGREHRPVAGVDGQWLADVIGGLEGCPELLERLPVMVSSLRTVRGDRLVLSGAARVEVRHSPTVRAVERVAAAPIRFGAVVAALAAEFPTAPESTVRRMLAELVTQGFLVTGLRAPATVTDPLAHLVDQLHRVRADEVAAVAATVGELAAVAKELNNHNAATGGGGDRALTPVIRRMRRLSTAGRSPISVDLRLDCDVELPAQVAGEMEAAASVLLRLSAQPGGQPVWRDFLAAFVEAYGTGTLVPVREAVDPDLGLGFPATYPGSLLEPPAPPGLSTRDDRLLALAQQATIDGTGEIVLDEAMVRDLTVADLDPARIPPHVELTARVHAKSPEALERGEFTVTVIPARAAGTMTGRFTTNLPGGAAETFRRLPTSDADAINAQLSVPPLYPHAENISRTPRFLDYIISLGEHRATDDENVIDPDDLAITADRHRLRLISLSRGLPVEPQVFHALRLDKQLPPLARFLVNLPRSHTATYTEFDWGAAAGLPYLPRVRYGRSVLSPARWQVRAAELPDRRAAWAEWRCALARWAQRWRLPDNVELRDGDRVLRLDLTEPAHAALLRLQMERAGEAVLTEAADPAGYGWLGGHAHQLAITLLADDRRAAASQPPRVASLVHLHSRRHGQLPAAPETQWLFAKLYVHPAWQTEVIAEHLPALLTHLGDLRVWWFLRYRLAHEPDHLRLRFHVHDAGDYGTCAATIGAWAAHLRERGISRRLVLDTYYPELGRYGDGPTLTAAETVFAADSRAVLTQLRHIPPVVANPVALAVANLVDLACGFTGGTEPAMAWLAAHSYDGRPAPAARSVRDQAVALVDPAGGFTAVRELPGGEELAGAWTRRRAALDAYRRHLPDPADRDNVLASLLHMHHIRALGVDRDSERVCRRLARAVALSWQTRNGRR